MEPSPKVQTKTQQLNSPFFSECLNRLHHKLAEYLIQPTEQTNTVLDAMRYSTLNGGKRIRALLTYATAKAVGTPTEHADIPACAVEMIHAFSLIHDDLPAMDDDDLRRGQPTCHIAFDEATAILAGDALQTLAFEILSVSNTHLTPSQQIRMIQTLAKASGAQGMTWGQYLDIQQDNAIQTLEDLQTMHHLKTGRLIEASVALGYLQASDLSTEYQQHLDQFAHHIGIAFQIQDDILDITQDTETLGKTAGRDVTLGKITYPEVLGMEKSLQCVQKHFDTALANLTSIPHTEDLTTLAHYIVYRNQ